MSIKNTINIRKEVEHRERLIKTNRKQKDILDKLEKKIKEKEGSDPCKECAKRREGV